MSYATNRFVGDGVTTVFNINFAGGYLSRDHVVAALISPSNTQTPVTIPPSAWLGDYTLQLSPVAYGDVLIIRRRTPATPLVDFTNGSKFAETALDIAARQGLFLAAEAIDASAPGDPADNAALEAALAEVRALAASMPGQVSSATLAASQAVTAASQAIAARDAAALSRSQAQGFADAAALSSASAVADALAAGVSAEAADASAAEAQRWAELAILGGGGGGGGGGFRPVKVAVIGDSMAAVQPLGSPTWPEIWAQTMRNLGINISLANLAVSGSTFYRATHNADFGGITMVDRCIALNPTVVFVALGANDSILNVDSRTLAQTQSDATALLDALGAGLPDAAIVIVNERMYDSTNFPTPGTTLLNKGVFPGVFTKPASGILSGSYTAEMLDTDVGATTRGRYANWLALMATANAHPAATTNVVLDAWKVYRLGLGGTDGIHFTEGGNKFLAGNMVRESQNITPLKANWPAVSMGTFAPWADPDNVFADTLVASGTGWAISPNTFASDWVAKHGGYGVVIRPDTWWAPSGGSVRLSTLGTPYSATQPTYWQVTNARPRQACSVSVNGGAFGAAGAPDTTDAYGNALFMANAAVLAVGSWVLRYKVGDEVFGPFTQVISAGSGGTVVPPHLLVAPASELWASAPNSFVVMPYGNVVANTGGGSYSSGAYTVPVAGLYSVSHVVGHQMAAGQISVAAVYVNGNSVFEGNPASSDDNDGGGNFVGSACYGTVRLALSDKVTFRVFRTGTNNGASGYGYAPGGRGRSCTASLVYVGA